MFGLHLGLRASGCDYYHSDFNLTVHTQQLPVLRTHAVAKVRVPQTIESGDVTI